MSSAAKLADLAVAQRIPVGLTIFQEGLRVDQNKILTIGEASHIDIRELIVCGVRTAMES